MGSVFVSLPRIIPRPASIASVEKLNCIPKLCYFRANIYYKLQLKYSTVE